MVTKRARPRRHDYPDFAIPKPVKQTKQARRLAQRTKRVLHYGGSEDWPALREACFVRDRYCCLLCGADHCRTGVALEAHHATAHVGMGGSKDPERFTLDDMATLCADCHARAERGAIPRDAIIERIPRGEA